MCEQYCEVDCQEVFVDVWCWVGQYDYVVFCVYYCELYCGVQVVYVFDVQVFWLQVCENWLCMVVVFFCCCVEFYLFGVLWYQFVQWQVECVFDVVWVFDVLEQVVMQEYDVGVKDQFEEYGG